MSENPACTSVVNLWDAEEGNLVKTESYVVHRNKHSPPKWEQMEATYSELATARESASIACLAEIQMLC